MVTMIYGRSGSGKSRSMKNLPRESTLVINVQGKPLPFKGAFPMTYKPKGNEGLVNGIKNVITKTLAKYPQTKVIIIDDAGYLMTKRFMAKHRQMIGTSQFDLYNEIADDMWTLVDWCNRLPEDVNTYIMMHERQSDYGDVTLRTIGNLLDNKVVLEGMITVCLRCMTDGKEHWFQTQNSGNDITKSPEDMFPELKIENDLQKVDEYIRAYYSTENVAS